MFSQLIEVLGPQVSPANPQLSDFRADQRKNKLATGRKASTGRIRIQCRAIVGSISGLDYYEFGVNEMRQSGLVSSRL